MKTAFLILSGAFFATFPAAAADWRPIDASELSLKQPKLQPDADTEAIFWEVSIEDRLMGDTLSVSFNNYVRLKIYTERGVKEHATVEIPRFGRRSIMDVSGRTIKPNGAIVELRKDAIFDRDLVKTKGFKVKGKSFALPQVEPGDVIEYQFREVRDNEMANYLHLDLQREFPVWRASYQLKPLQLAWLPWGMRSLPFNAQPTPFERSKTRAGFFETHVDNLPALKTEPYMPPLDQVRSWLLVFYEEDRKLEPEKFWKSVGKSEYNDNKPLTKADSNVKKLAEELVTGLDKPELKLAAFDRFCRTKIRNPFASATTVSAEERKAFKPNTSAGSTLKQKMGTGADINYLFVALAQAVGLDARIARVPDRERWFFSPNYPTKHFIPGESVAVKSGDAWTFYDPGTPLLPPGSIRWQEEGVPALISDPKDGYFVTTPQTPATASVRKRRALFKLLDDGTLEGALRFEYTGHVGVDQKRRLDDMSEAERMDDWKDALISRLSTAEVSDLKIENVLDSEQPIQVTCKISVPGYATRTGKRILLQPAFFQRNVGALFPSNAREHHIYFHYGYTEDDEIVLELPEGWVLDKPSAPGSYNIDTIGEYAVDLKKTPDSRKLIYTRRFVWGKQGALILDKVNYPAIKNVFDKIHEQDNHLITLIPEGASGAK